MKYFKYLFFLIILLAACKKEYYDIDANEKEIFLFNAYNIGDTFRMTNYNNDTITFRVVQKDIKYIKRYHSFNKYDQYYILAFTCDKMDNMPAYHSGGVYFTREDTDIFLNDLCVKRVIEKKDTLTVNGVFYNNLYKLSNGIETYALISKKYGIVKMWNPYIEYQLLP